MITGDAKALALDLFTIDAIKFGSFRLKLHEKSPDAPLSPIYLDLRLLRSFPEVMEKTVAVYSDIARGLTYDLIADIPTAATPIAAILSFRMKIPMISPRMDKKGHGTRLPIDGAFEAGKTVLVIDDLITKADSKLEAISVLESHNLIVNDLLILVDREQGGIQTLANKGYRSHCLFKLTEILSLYLQTKLIGQADFERTMEYLGKP